MSELKAPPPRPSTERVAAPPMAALRDMSRPRAVTVSFWGWMLASLVVAAAVALQSTKIDPMQTEFARVASISDPGTSPETIDRVAGVSVLLLLGVGALLGLLGLMLAGALRAGRNWARLLLTLVALSALGYAAFLGAAANDAMFGTLRSPISLVLAAYAAVITVAGVSMLLPGTKPWFHRPRRSVPLPR
jgi:hypothetical protein